MIKRTIYKQIIYTIKNKAVTVIYGDRQVRKTTLCSLIKQDLKFNYVSLADPIIRKRAIDNPSEFLSLNPSPLIIDEVQKAPILFDYLEGIVDKKIKKGNSRSLYVLTGSQIYKLMKDVSESMSGRIGIINMSPLSLSEIYKQEELPFSLNINRIKERCENYQIETKEIYKYIFKGFYPELYINEELKTSNFYSDYLASI